MAGKERLEDGRMVIRHPSGKVELVSHSEQMADIWGPEGRKQEALAQLGARVLEIMRERGWDVSNGTIGEWQMRLGCASVIDAARSLGLLGEEGDK